MFIQRLCFVFRYIKIPHTGHFCFLDLYEGILLLFFSRSASCKPSSDGFNIYFYNFRNIRNTHFPVSERICYIFLLVHSCFIIHNNSKNILTGFSVFIYFCLLLLYCLIHRCQLCCLVCCYTIIDYFIKISIHYFI